MGKASSKARLTDASSSKKVLKTSKGPSVGANYRLTTTTASDGVLDDKSHYCFVRVHVDDFLIAGDPHLVWLDRATT